jgi:hypothetical protein
MVSEEVVLLVLALSLLDEPSPLFFLVLLLLT